VTAASATESLVYQYGCPAWYDLPPQLVTGSWPAEEGCEGPQGRPGQLLLASRLWNRLVEAQQAHEKEKSHGAAATAAVDPTYISLTGVGLAQIATGVLGALLITSEYATGQVRTTFAAVPRRLPVLYGKAAALTLALLVVCVPATFLAFLIAQPILSPHHLSTSLGHPGTARAVLGCGLYLVAIGLLGLGLGALLRHTAGAIVALFGVLFGLELVAGFLPGTWSGQVSKYLPMNAGTDIENMGHNPGSLAPWTGFGLLCLYAIAVLAVASWRLRHRDA
jgi:ABC-2 type transport system permease protein